MPHRRFLLACAGLMMLSAGRATQAQEQTPCRQRSVSASVRVHNNAAVPADVLRYAKAYATSAYRRIGVELHWRDYPEAIPAGGGRPYVMVLMTSQASEPDGTESGTTDDVVGQAVSVARRAYVHYDRVVGLAQPPDRDLVTFLGYAMAHELGHLMLPGRGHAAAGIMRASLPLTSRSLNAFTPVEARLICVRLDQEARGRG